MNEGANKFRKTVKMDFATVEISDSASDYSDSESDNSEARRQRSKKSAFNRRPSVNPALLNLSSSSSETMSGKKIILRIQFSAQLEDISGRNDFGTVKNAPKLGN